jgi:glycerophosphoryl diester phosphodiesterase
MDDVTGRRGLDGLLGLRLRRRASIDWSASGDPPQVVAHRGSSEKKAEHTLAAYVEAMDEGAEALECDVRLTADGHLVCMHDRRIERTSNGRGAVSTLELQQLEELDWESWKQPWPPLDDETVAPDPRGSSILTLERLLDTVRDYDRRVEVAIETKHPTRFAGLVERRLVELLDRFGWARPRRGTTSPARIMSFSWMSLRRCLELAPTLQTVYLMDRVPLRFRDGSLPLGASAAGPSIEIIRAHPEYVAKVHRTGNQVHVWTVNNPVDVELCAALGVDAVITDKPGNTLQLLSERTA